MQSGRAGATMAARMKTLPLSTALSFACLGLVIAADPPKPKPKPAFQYQTEGIQISIPTADEPRVKAFGPESLEAAAKYLDQGSISWVREKACINCHTTGPYMAERPALTKFLGAPVEEIRDDFAESVPSAEPPKEGETPKRKPNANSAVWCSAGLAEWDKHVSGKLSEATDRSLRDMMTRQAEHGGFPSTGEVEIPHITTDFELTLHAARAVTVAPGWLAGLKEKNDSELLARVEKMKNFLRESKPRNDFEVLLRLQLATYFPDTVTTEQKERALNLLKEKQHSDGGWSLRDMSATENWRTEMSDTVLNLIRGLPDAAKPESDPYMTALAIVLMRQSGVEKTDDRVQRGIAWLKREQRVSGRWWMHSLYRGNYHYITYIATAQAMKALALCEELDIAAR